MVTCELSEGAIIIGTDNGNQVSHEPFKTNYRKAFHGKCLFIVQAGKEKGTVNFVARAEGLGPAEIDLVLN